MLKITLLLVLLLSGCGGGAIAGAYPMPEKIFAHPSDRVEWAAASFYDRVILPTAEGANQSVFLPVAQDAANQSTLGPNVMLWAGGRSQAAYERFPALLQEAKKYNNIKSVYVYDELCWSASLVIEFPCENVQEVTAAAHMVQSAGLESVIVMLPHVILHPGFTVPDINAFGMIGIDIYPGMLINEELYGCKRGANIIEDFLMCSIERLRAMGYTGKIGYVYQGFAMRNHTLERNLADADMQRLVIDHAMAGKYDITAVMPWGIYLGAHEQAAEPVLQPLGGTPWEYLVRP